MEYRERVSKLAAWIAVASNILLTVLKLVIGYIFASNALVADGYHSAADVLASVAVLIAMKVSNRPADEDHPYGHGKAEVIASAVVAGVLTVASLEIGIGSIEALTEPAHKPHWIAFATAGFSWILKQLLYTYTLRLGKKLKSPGLVATAIDHQADVYASIAAVAGIGAALIGSRLQMPVFYYADPVAGFVVALLILKLAYETGREAVEILMERNVDPDKLHAFSRTIFSVQHVKRLDRLRARAHGHYILVDVRVGVPGTITVQEGHDVARSIRDSIKRDHPDVKEVLVHVNPWYENEEK
ncbi:cation diffusion facilitator family transporter [Effusibacillus lacus]|uniref:Cation diffusion facilitator family transporter n=1 Tax=Effusibacillus lacus TaxID=1348429 RepID=A0A292YL29_9BACL|nr:cation diffusion facilitator family transporter [Effusibacillus lacus]TCS69430.1 cation diffusion facilitator family transporter [Effusibacillus lacus]GAX89195.1 cation diffusion facilitator family transporter [Effusibacillus lacus]